MVFQNAKFWLSAAAILFAGVGCDDSSKSEGEGGEVDDTAESDADTDTDTDTDTDADTDADTDTDTDTDTDADTDADALFTVDTALVTFDFAVQGGVITDLPGQDSVMRVHFFEKETFHYDLDRPQDQCGVEVSLTGSTPVDLTADYPGLLGAWAIEDVPAAIAGTAFRCDFGDLTAIGGDPTAFVSSLELGFGLATMDAEHSTAFESSVEGWEAVSDSAAFGILNASLEGSLTAYDQYIVLGYALDGDNVAVEDGEPVLLDLQTAWYLPDGVYQARPVATEVDL